MASLRPADALSPEGFYSLYLGGLAIDDERRRRDVCYVLLLMGRLGIRAAEIGHLHEGWIDWSRGDIHVPAHDPCACKECWERASRQSERDDRSVEEIIREEYWTPPEGPRAARSLTFGWSNRLTGAIEAVLGERAYLDADRQAIEALVTEATENAWELDTEQVSLSNLRASAGVFLARAGFGPRRLADLLVIDEETAGEFARVGGGELRNHLYRSLPQTPEPDICGENSPYRLVCDPTPFEREPFDPRTYNTKWRTERAESSDKRERNPRPPVPPESSSLDPATDLKTREPAADSGAQLVDESLADWVKRRESQRRQYAETGSSGLDDAGGDYRDLVTAPAEFSLSTRFAGQGIENGRPTGGSVVLGQRELVFVSRDATGVAETLRVDFDSLVDIAPGFVPGPLKGIFEETVGLAYHDDHDERKVVICELPSGLAWEFQRTLFAALLEEVPAVFANLSEVSDESEVPEANECMLTANTRTLKIEQPDSDRLPTRIRLSTIVDVEEKPMQSEVGYDRGLTVRHLEVNANVVKKELRPIDDTRAKFLKRYLTEYHERQKSKARNVSLSEEQRDALDALLDAGDGRDLVTLLDMNPSRVSNVLESLKEIDLIRDSRTGLTLTGTGYLATTGRLT